MTGEDWGRGLLALIANTAITLGIISNATTWSIVGVLFGFILLTVSFASLNEERGSSDE